MTLEELDLVCAKAMPGPYLYKNGTVLAFKVDNPYGIPLIFNVGTNLGNLMAAAGTYMPRLIAVAKAAYSYDQNIGHWGDVQEALAALEAP